jgi:hypothetical protein
MPLNLTRSILAIIIPGGVAVAPWLVLVHRAWPSLSSLYSEFPLLVNGVIFGVVVVLGTIFESFGSAKEFRWDKEIEEELGVTENWYQYLARTVDPEPVAHRYISRLVTSLYFELTMTFATMMFALGTSVIAFFSDSRLNVFAGIGLIAAGLLFSAYFQIQAKKTHRVLCETRKELNERIDGAA